MNLSKEQWGVIVSAILAAIVAILQGAFGVTIIPF